MTQGLSSFRRAAAPREQAAKRLSQRQDLPPRVRHMLTGLLGLATGSLAQSLLTALDEFEKELFDRASKAHTNEQCNRYFDSLREVKRARADAGPRFLLALENTLANFDKRRVPGHAEPARSDAASAELSLIETTELEDSLALQEVATKCEVRQALMLHELGHRFGVLAGQRAFEADSVPLGPAQLMAAVHDATAGMDLPIEHRVLLYHTYERVVVNQIGPFYAALNAFFFEHRILRHLRVYVPLPPRSKGNGPPEAAPTQAFVARDAGAAMPLPVTPAVPPADSGRSSGAEHGAATAASGLALPAVAPPPGPRPAAATGAATDAPDSDLFATLRGLLASRQSAAAARPPQRPRAGGYVPSTDALQAVLAKLQSKPVVPAGDNLTHAATQLKQDLLDQLHQFAPAGQKAQLNSEDSDTIDLVGMLFDQITQSAPAKGNTQSMLTKLHVPLLRVALSDKGFFSQRSHPARQLLNAIAETGIHWIDDSESEPDPALLHKLHTVVERLNSEFDGDLSLIEHMLGDLSQHMHKLARNAAVAERRLVDSSKGREKLALARETASNAIAQRVGAARPKRLLRTLLERAWTDVLALTLMSQGEKSEAYRKQLAVADQLIAAASGASHGTGEPPAAALRREVEKGLSQVGYHKDEIHAVVKRLLTPETTSEENPTSQTYIAMRIKSKAPLGESADDEKPMQAAAQRKAALRLTEAEEKVLESLKVLPFGTWFEFAVNQQGDRVRRKLSWFSPLTGHCLFVNQRGERARERTLEQLARDIVHGQANIVKPEQESLVDRAWKAIVASLRQLTGQSANTPAVPA